MSRSLEGTTNNSCKFPLACLRARDREPTGEVQMSKGKGQSQGRGLGQQKGKGRGQGRGPGQQQGPGPWPSEEHGKGKGKGDPGDAEESKDELECDLEALVVFWGATYGTTVTIDEEHKILLVESFVSIAVDPLFTPRGFCCIMQLCAVCMPLL